MHLIGQHLLGALVEEFEDLEEMEEEMLDEEEGDDSQFKVSKKLVIIFEVNVKNEEYSYVMKSGFKLISCLHFLTIYIYAIRFYYTISMSTL